MCLGDDYERKSFVRIILSYFAVIQTKRSTYPALQPIKGLGLLQHASPTGPIRS